jgi:hypothetical protein
MKRSFVIVGVLMSMVILSVGCTPKAQPAAAPQNVTGELKYLSVPLEGGNATLTVQTPQGPQTVQLAANTTYSLQGKACSIDDIGQALTAGDTTYNCTVILDPCEPGIVAQYMSVMTIVK